ncbi:MAG TPA: hypothetical protein VKU89_02790 [Solirubrobacteraceae bacterium]|nr:hypothetical protein [Solirubrobacteraceae bacterium]
MLERAEDLLGRIADDSLLEGGEDLLPSDVGFPEPLVPSRARGRLVALGVALTATSLLAGVALIAIGAVELIGGGSALGIGALASGALLVATHWGWVHVAEVGSDALEQRAGRSLRARRERWLQDIEPYTRYEVSTAAAPDGAIEIVRLCYRPVGCGDRRFRFQRTVELRERHQADEPAAVVAERAEQLRREAALATEGERRRYQEMRDSEHAEKVIGAEAQQLLDARRAASQALSEQINANLREPPIQG